MVGSGTRDSATYVALGIMLSPFPAHAGSRTPVNPVAGRSVLMEADVQDGVQLLFDPPYVARCPRLSLYDRDA